MTCAKLLMYAFRKWIVMDDAACENKFSRAVAHITIRLQMKKLQFRQALPAYQS